MYIIKPLSVWTSYWLHSKKNTCRQISNALLQWQAIFQPSIRKRRSIIKVTRVKGSRSKVKVKFVWGELSTPSTCGRCDTRHFHYHSIHNSLMRSHLVIKEICYSRFGDFWAFLLRSLYHMVEISSSHAQKDNFLGSIGHNGLCSESIRLWKLVSCNYITTGSLT